MVAPCYIEIKIRGWIMNVINEAVLSSGIGIYVITNAILYINCTKIEPIKYDTWSQAKDKTDWIATIDTPAIIIATYEM